MKKKVSNFKPHYILSLSMGLYAQLSALWEALMGEVPDQSVAMPNRSCLTGKDIQLSSSMPHTAAADAATADDTTWPSINGLSEHHVQCMCERR